MAEGSVTLSQEELRVLREVLAEDLEGVAKGMNEQQQRALLRVVLKVQAVDKSPYWEGGLLGDTPEWIQRILRKTFTPPPAPAKKPAPKAAATASPKKGTHSSKPAIPADEK